METFALKSDELDSLGYCSHSTLRSCDLLPRLANHLLIVLDTIGNRFDKSGVELNEVEQAILTLNLDLIAEAVSFNELNADGYGSAYPESSEQEAQEIIASLFQALDELSPDDHYFGSHPGDGADFNYWECEF
jgi:hypothetical protein